MVPKVALKEKKSEETKEEGRMIKKILDDVKKRNPGEAEFHQAVEEVLESVEPVLHKHPEFKEAKILERIVEPAPIFCILVWTIVFCTLYKVLFETATSFFIKPIILYLFGLFTKIS